MITIDKLEEVANALPLTLRLQSAFRLGLSGRPEYPDWATTAFKEDYQAALYECGRQPPRVPGEDNLTLLYHLTDAYTRGHQRTQWDNEKMINGTYFPIPDEHAKDLHEGATYYCAPEPWKTYTVLSKSAEGVLMLTNVNRAQKIGELSLVPNNEFGFRRIDDDELKAMGLEELGRGQGWRGIDPTTGAIVPVLFNEANERHFRLTTLDTTLRAHYGAAKDDDTSHIRDLIIDLRHLCDREGVDLYDELDRSYPIYIEEKKDMETLLTPPALKPAPEWARGPIDRLVEQQEISLRLHKGTPLTEEQFYREVMARTVEAMAKEHPELYASIHQDAKDELGPSTTQDAAALHERMVRLALEEEKKELQAALRDMAQGRGLTVDEEQDIAELATSIMNDKCADGDLTAVEKADICRRVVETAQVKVETERAKDREDEEEYVRRPKVMERD